MTDGSKRLPGEPVVLSFAFSDEEWAQISAAMEQVRTWAYSGEELGIKPNAMLVELTETCERLGRLVNAGMHDYYEKKKEAGK